MLAAGGDAYPSWKQRNVRLSADISRLLSGDKALVRQLQRSAGAFRSADFWCHTTPLPVALLMSSSAIGKSQSVLLWCGCKCGCNGLRAIYWGICRTGEASAEEFLCDFRDICGGSAAADSVLEDLASLLPASEQQLALRAALEAEGGRSAIPDTAGKLRSPCTKLKSLPTPHTAGKHGRHNTC